MAVYFIPHNRAAQKGTMQPDLVSPSGQRMEFKQRVRAKDWPEYVTYESEIGSDRIYIYRYAMLMTTTSPIRKKDRYIFMGHRATLPRDIEELF